MVDLKFNRKLINVGSLLGFTIPVEIVEHLKLKAGEQFIFDAITVNGRDVISLERRMEVEENEAGNGNE